MLYDYRKMGELGFEDYISQIKIAPVSDEICKAKNNASYDTYKKTENMFCAAHLNATDKDKNVCWGDVGAGLVYKLPTGWIVRGIVCRFDKVCDHSRASYYTDLVPYYDWIQNTIRELREI